MEIKDIKNKDDYNTFYNVFLKRTPEINYIKVWRGVAFPKDYNDFLKKNSNTYNENKIKLVKNIEAKHEIKNEIERNENYVNDIDFNKETHKKKHKYFNKKYNEDIDINKHKEIENEGEEDNNDNEDDENNNILY
jgi:hypothetical protein